MTLRGLVAWITIVLAAGAAPCGAAPTEPVPVRVPRLVIDPDGGYRTARYGYRDTVGDRMAIPAIWADARPLRNGFAVVGKRQPEGDGPPVIRYGVIDGSGKPIISPEYDAVELVSRGPLTLVFTKKQYNAWWRFWHASGERWQVPPQYDYLQDELVPGIAVYRGDMTARQSGGILPVRRYGLIDIAQNKAVTPLIYDFVDTDGLVGQLREITNGYGVKLPARASGLVIRKSGNAYVMGLDIPRTPDIS